MVAECTATAGRLDNTRSAVVKSEIMSMSEVLKEAKLMQYNLEFCGMGLLPIVLSTQERFRKNARHFATREVSEK